MKKNVYLRSIIVLQVANGRDQQVMFHVQLFLHIFAPLHMLKILLVLVGVISLICLGKNFRLAVKFETFVSQCSFLLFSIHV